MTNKELYYFACQCLSLDEHPEFKKVIINILSDEDNCQNFIRICSNHLVLPAIYLKFQSHDILQHLPEELTEFLEEIHQLNLTRNEQILKQLQEIMHILNEQEIYPTILKGAGNLLENLYSNMGERMMGDIDFLVSEEDYLKAAKILGDDGYKHLVQSFFEVKDLKDYPRLYKKDVPADVEIHRLPVPLIFTKWYNTEIIDREKKAIIGDFSCFVLSDKHKVIHNFIHTQLSNRGHSYGVVPLRDLNDLYLISKRTDISQTINFIQDKRKAVTYFLFAGKALNLPNLFNHKETLAYRLFCLKHDINFKSYTFYRANKSFVYMTDRIYKYFKQMIQSIYSKSMRRSLYIRLKNREWYEYHINTYLDFFSGKK